MMTRYLIIFLFTFLTTTIVGQDTQPKKWDKDLGVSIGYIHQDDNFLTTGLTLGKGAGNIHTGGWSCGLATEFNLQKDNFIMGVKTYYDINMILLGARINAISYFKESSADLRLTPEIGLTLVGVINFYYGYNIPIAGTELDEISRYRFSVTVNLFSLLNGNDE